MSVSGHPWRDIDLDVYERHMGDVAVGQLLRLHEITGEQLAAYPSSAVAVIGVAGGNGLDLIAPEEIEAIFGFDVNPEYLAACDLRFRGRFGDRLHLVEANIGPESRIEPVGLLIANLVVEYIGLDEFVAFVDANRTAISVVSTVTQCNSAAGLVSESELSAAFDGLSAVASEIDSGELEREMASRGFPLIWSGEAELPNGKALIRQDFHVSA